MVDSYLKCNAEIDFFFLFFSFPIFALLLFWRRKGEISSLLCLFLLNNCLMVGVIIIINFFLNFTSPIILLLYATGSGPLKSATPPPNRHGPWTKKVTHDAPLYQMTDSYNVQLSVLSQNEPRPGKILTRGARTVVITYARHQAAKNSQKKYC